MGVCEREISANYLETNSTEIRLVCWISGRSFRSGGSEIVTNIIKIIIFVFLVGLSVSLVDQLLLSVSLKL